MCAGFSCRSLLCSWPSALAWDTSLGHKQKPSSEVTYHQLTFRKGTVLSARFAPDNRTVIYAAAWGGSPPELFSTRQDSIESRPSA